MEFDFSLNINHKKFKYEP